MINLPNPKQPNYKDSLIRKCSKIFLSTIMVLLFLSPLLPSAHAQGDTQNSSQVWFLKQGSQIKFLNINAEDGLADNGVWTLIQDSNGFMWFGTAGGLSKYDAYNFETFTKDTQDKNSLSENLVRSILEDSQGNLWIGTWDNGVNFMDGRSGEITRYMLDPDDPNSLGGNQVRCLLEDREGRIWVATADGGLNLYNPEEDNFTRYQFDEDDPTSISSDSVFKLVEDQDGMIWVGTSGGGLDHFDPKTSEFTHTEKWKNSVIIDLEIDPQGKFWVATWGAGLYHYDPDSGETTAYRAVANSSASLSNDLLLAIELDENGYLWIGTDGTGLDILNIATGEFQNFVNNPLDPESIPDNHIRDIFMSENNLIWLATWGGGASILSPDYNQFNHFKSIPNVENSLSNNKVTSFVEGKDGILWIGTEGGGLNYYNPFIGEFGVYKHDPGDETSLSNDSVRTLDIDEQGQIWVGTIGGGVNILDPKTGKFTRLDFLEEGLCESILDIYIQPKETIWLGCFNGLVKLNPSSEEYTAYFAEPENESGLYNDFITSILPDGDGNLWLATFGGLHFFSPDSETFVRYLHDDNDPTTISNNNVVSLLIDSKGRLWAATFGGGLNLFDPVSGSFTLIGKDKGIPQDNINGLLEADPSQENKGVELWVSTSEGIVQYFPDEETATTFTESNGLQGDSYNPNAAYKTAAGDLLFGGTNGFNMFNPAELKINSNNPKLTLTEFYISFEEVPVTEDGILQQLITQTEELVLPYDTQIFSFEFAALDYVNASNINYRYMLEGFEDHWVEVPGDRRFITFTNLDPGNYTLRVQLSYGNGQWSEEEIALKITITPPWWQTLWFKFAAIIFTIAVMAVGYYYRIGALERQKRQLERQVHDRTLELEQSNRALQVTNKELESFSYSVSHDLRAPLRAIQGFTQIIAEDYAEKLDGEGVEYFARVEEAAKRMNALIDALLDLSRLSRKDLEFTQVNMSQIAEEELSELQTQFAVDEIEADITPDIYLQGDERLMRILLHNLLENAVKYSLPKDSIKISFGTMQLDGENVYFVKDAGIGFDEEHKEKIFEVFQRAHVDDDISGTGIGLAIVQRIIRKHGGEIWAESEVNKGSTFYFKL